MKYLADDGTAFDSEEACRHHEMLSEHMVPLLEQVEHYLQLKSWRSMGTTATARRYILSWLAYDTKQRPERYGIDFSGGLVSGSEEK